MTRTLLVHDVYGSLVPAGMRLLYQDEIEAYKKKVLAMGEHLSNLWCPNTRYSGEDYDENSRLIKAFKHNSSYKSRNVMHPYRGESEGPKTHPEGPFGCCISPAATNRECYVTWMTEEEFAEFGHRNDAYQLLRIEAKPKEPFFLN